ncbi:MAG: hypothetical protein O9264_11970 [Leptospira sp.]|nr:hypothetical protein [Leptospira sp.]
MKGWRRFSLVVVSIFFLVGNIPGGNEILEAKEKSPTLLHWETCISKIDRCIERCRLYFPSRMTRWPDREQIDAKKIVNQIMDFRKIVIFTIGVGIAITINLTSAYRNSKSYHLM